MPEEKKEKLDTERERDRLARQREEKEKAKRLMKKIKGLMDEVKEGDVGDG